VTRVVVTGASGLLGASVLRDLAGQRIDTEGWSFRLSALPDGTVLRRLDLCGPGELERALRDAAPELVVHCAALTDVDACEDDPAAARSLNAKVPGRLGAAALALGAGFVHVSTDAVYDGEREGAHTEDEPPGPANLYARTKLEGEQAALDAHPEALVLRTNMHGWSAGGKTSFSEAILRGLLARRRLTLFADVRFSPLAVSDLAAVIRQLAQRRARGVLNAGASDAVTKEEFGRIVARSFGLSEDPIEPIAVADLGLRAPRPRNSALAVERLADLLGAPPPTVADGVRHMREDADTGAASRLKGQAAGPLDTLLRVPA
jgi:dTDP-4-dehydrorhamnose reductase